MRIYIVTNWVINNEYVGSFSSKENAEAAIKHLVDDNVLAGYKKEDFKIEEGTMDELSKDYQD